MLQNLTQNKLSLKKKYLTIQHVRECDSCEERAEAAWCACGLMGMCVSQKYLQETNYYWGFYHKVISGILVNHWSKYLKAQRAEKSESRWPVLRGYRNEFAIMAFTSLITAIVLTSLGVLNVEGTAKGAVPLDTLTFDKVFLNHTVCGFVLDQNRQICKLK